MSVEPRPQSDRELLDELDKMLELAEKLRREIDEHQSSHFTTGIVVFLGFMLLSVVCGWYAFSDWQGRAFQYLLAAGVVVGVIGASHSLAVASKDASHTRSTRDALNELLVLANSLADSLAARGALGAYQNATVRVRLRRLSFAPGSRKPLDPATSIPAERPRTS